MLGSFEGQYVSAPLACQVSQAEGQAVAAEFQMSYIESSACHGVGVTEVFSKVLQEVYHYKRHMQEAEQ